MDKETERDLLRSAQAGNKRAQDRLVAEHMGLIRGFAARWRGRGLDYEDLVQEAAMAFLHAIAKYQLTHEARLSTYASYWMEARLTRACAKSSIVPTPDHVRARARRIERGDEAPDEDEHVYGFHQTVSMDTPVRDDLGTLHEMIADENAVAADANSVSVTALMAVLTPVEREIVCAYYGDPNEPTNSEIGLLHGISRERVRQIVNEAHAKMRKRAKGPL